MTSPISKDAVLDAVDALHREVDRQTAPLDGIHRERLQCRRGCAACCLDGLSVFEVEADLIRRHHAALLESGDAGPEGACAFLDASGACRIYEHRPYVCRTQGYPLRWIEEPDGEDSGNGYGEESAGGVVELRDICPLNDREDAPIEELDEESCWTLGPVESELARLQEDAAGTRESPGGGEEDDSTPLRRVTLRSLFRQKAGT